MPTFNVNICRIGYSTKDIEVEADTQEEANEKALEAAGNHEFNEKESDYALADELTREDRLDTLLREIHNEIGRRVDEDADNNPKMASPFADLDNCDIMLRIRKELHK
mgnify:CR=1 FL=1